MPMRWTLLLGALVLSAGGAAAQLPAPPASAREPLRLGGYGSVVFGHSSRAGSPTADALSEAAASLLLSGSLGPRLSYLTEIEAASRTSENWTGRQNDRAPQLNRLYVELSLGDPLRLRAGRFLTPVGQWNEVHADPLTWTSLRPLTTYRPFAKSTTGFMAAGQFPIAGHDAGYALYVAPFRTGTDREETSFVNAGGGRVAIELLPGLYLGASGAVYRASRPLYRDDDGEIEPEPPEDGTAEVHEPEDRTEDTRARRLLGADLSWSVGRLEALAEATLLSGGPEAARERGAFAQASVRVLGPARLVARGEVYDPVGLQPLRILTIGTAARLPHLTLKLERQLPDRPSLRVANGWFVSASAIF